MSEQTKIQWCDFTFNPWSGCTKVAEGCKFCYAEVNYSVKMRGVKWGPNGNRIKASESMWKQPLKWNRRCEREDFIECCGCGHRSFMKEHQLTGFCDHCGDPEGGSARPRVFCASLADVFEDWDGPILNSDGKVLHRHIVSGKIMPLADFPMVDPAAEPLTMDDLRRDLFGLIDATPNLDWLLLTKRPENIRRMWPERKSQALPHFYVNDRPNVWLSTSIATQADADKNIPELLKCRDRVPVLGLSIEPIVDKVVLKNEWLAKLDWVIIGGESGDSARPCDIAWIRSLVAQCQAASVACFVKQLGSVPYGDDSHVTGAPIDKANLTRLPGALMKDRKGGDPAEWPKDLRVRQFPSLEAANN